MTYSSTRRDRLRAEMFAEIKGSARLLLTAGGARAISLRAIAREIGITPAGIYRYYPSLQALTDALQNDILGELDTRIRLVRDQIPAGYSTVRLDEMARAFRRWALEHPAEFWLVLGPDSPGRTELASASRLPIVQFPRLAVIFLDEFLRLWQHGQTETPPACPARELTRVHIRMAAPARHLDVPQPAVLSFASAWAKLYGLVVMEVSDQMTWPPAMADAFFEAELAELGRRPAGRWWPAP